MADKVIIADAGHGLHTYGKEDPNGVKEWTYNQKVLKAFVAYLEKHYDGFKIVRTDDPTGRIDVPLVTRTNLAIANKGDVLISFHHNANTGNWGDWGGVETFVMDPISANPASTRLAKLVHPRVVKAMGLRDRGIKGKNLHMLREATGIPAILVEGGFMDSRTDIDALRDDAKLKAQGEAIAIGVAEYLGLPKKIQVPTAKVGIATMKTAVQSYASPSFNSSKVRVYKKGEKRNIYKVQNGWYLTHSGDWIPSNYGKNFTFEPVSKPDVTEPEVEQEVDGKVYRVITGSFSKKELAEKRADELKDKGFESFVIPKDL